MKLLRLNLETLLNGLLLQCDISELTLTFKFNHQFFG